MPIYTCPTCSTVFRLPDDRAGHAITCTTCGTLGKVRSTANAQAHTRSHFMMVVSATAAAMIIGVTVLIAIAIRYASPAPVDEQPIPDARIIEQQVRQAEESKRAEDKAKRIQQLFDDAKNVLVTRMDHLSGTPEANVRHGIQLLIQYIGHPNAPDRQEAKRLLEDAKLALSNEAVQTFLWTASDRQRYDFSHLARFDRRAAVKVDMAVIVKKSQLDSLQDGFSHRFTTPVPGDDAAVFVSASIYKNAIEASFCNTTIRNATQSIKVVAEWRQRESEQQEDQRRKEKQMLAALARQDAERRAREIAEKNRMRLLAEADRRELLATKSQAAYEALSAYHRDVFRSLSPAKVADYMQALGVLRRIHASVATDTLSKQRMVSIFNDIHRVTVVNEMYRILDTAGDWIPAYDRPVAVPEITLLTAWALWQSQLRIMFENGELYMMDGILRLR